MLHQDSEHLSEGRRSVCSKDVFAALLCHSVGQWESKTFRKELLDVWTLDIIGLFQLNNFQDL